MKISGAKYLPCKESDKCAHATECYNDTNKLNHIRCMTAKKSGFTVSNRNYLRRTSHLLHTQFPILPPLSDLAADQKIETLISLDITSEHNEPRYNEVELAQHSNIRIHVNGYNF